MFGSVVPALLLTGCWPKTAKPEDIAKANFTPYVPAQGDPRTITCWRDQGPGAIIRKGTNLVSYNAVDVLGKKVVTQIHANANPANGVTTRQPYALLSNKRTSGGTLDAQGGWTFSGATAIKAKLNLKNANSVDVQFGPTWSEQVTEQALTTGIKRAKIKAGSSVSLDLENGRRLLVARAIYTDSLSIYFKSVNAAGAEASVLIPLEQQQKLGANYTVTNDGGVVISGPIMVGYVPVAQATIRDMFGLPSTRTP